jgi:hypothetical protein
VAPTARLPKVLSIKPRVTIADCLGSVPDQPDHRLVRQPDGGHHAAGAQADEQGIVGVACCAVFQPAAQRGRGAQVRVVGTPDRDRLPCPVLVGLRAPDRQHDAFAIDELEVANIEPDDLGAPQGAAEAGEQDGAVAQTKRRGGLGADHTGELRRRDWRRLAGRTGAPAPADAVHQQGDARVTGVERQADQAVGRDDRSEVDLEGRDGEALGRGGQVHAD